MENQFLKSPLTVYLYNPLERQCTHAWVFVGDAPPKVVSAIGRAQGDTLRDYYGAQWKSKLAMGKFKHKIVDEYLDNVREFAQTEDVYSKSGASDFVCPTKSGGATTDNIQVDEISRMLGESHGRAAMSFTENELGAVGLKRAITIKTSPPVSWPAGQVTYSDVSVYPEDNFVEFKEKIFLATGIPLYRQHLFWITNRVQTTYNIVAHRAISADITAIADITDRVAGIPYDSELAAQADNIHVESQECFGILEHAPSTFFVVDAAIFTFPNQVQLERIVKDTYSMDMIYYGFVMKYFPTLASKECFIDFITAESDIFAKFPAMARPKTTLGYLYKAERQIVNSVYAARTKAIAARTSIAITHMTLSVQEQRCIIDIRNLFDKLKTSRRVPEIHAYVEYDRARWLLRKNHMRSGDIVFPSSAQFKIGVIIAIVCTGEILKHMFLNIHPSGKYWVKVVWREEENIDFEANLKLVKRHVDDIIKSINSLGRVVFIGGTQLPLPTAENIVYSGMNISLMWKRVLPEQSFKVLKTLFDPYQRAGIILPRNVQQFDKYEFTWHKGMYEFDQTLLERIVVASGEQNFNNTYTYMTSSLVKQKWDQHYTGRIVRMTHRTTDVRFEVVDVHQHEFEIFHRYMLGFIHAAENNEQLNSIKSHSVKKLNKLQEQDPELFRLKMHDPTLKVYSILCQNARQPYVYAPDEIAKMPADVVKRLTQYWNFTTRSPAYYACPNKDYPHLSFITGMHPKGYCLPCCNKKAESGSALKAEIKRSCLTTHTFTSEAKGQRHIMTYGKHLDEDRLARLPQTIVKLLFTAGIHAESSVPVVRLGGDDSDSDFDDVESNDETDIDETDIGAILEDNSKTGVPKTGISKIGVPKTGGVKYKRTTTAGYYIVGVPQTVAADSGYHGLTYALAKALDMSIGEFITDITGKMTARPELFYTLSHGTISQYVDTMQQLIDLLRDVYIHGAIYESKRVFNDYADLFMDLAPYIYGIHCVCFIDRAQHVDEENINVYVNPVTRQALELGAGDTRVLLVQKVGNYVAPIFHINIDEYYGSGSEIVAERTFEIDHPIVQTIITLIKSEGREETIIPEGVRLAIMTNSNKCCGVIVARGTAQCHIPLRYGWVEAPAVTYTPDELRSTALDLELTLEVAREVGYAVDYYVAHIKPDGRQLWVGVHYTNGMTSYFNVGTPPADARWTAVHCHPLDVMEAIAASAPPIADGRVTGYQRAMYDAYSYQLLLVEFINYLETDRNKPLRTKIYDTIMRSRGEFYSKVRDLIEAEGTTREQRDADLKSIREKFADYTFGHYSKHHLIAELEHSVFEFDKLTVNQLRQLPQDQVKTLVAKIVSSITTPGELSEGAFPNIYTPCGGDRLGVVALEGRTVTKGESADTSDPETSRVKMSRAIGKKDFVYCRGSRLILNNVSDYLEILVADFTSPIKLRYILSSLFADSTAEFFKFIQSSMEEINVYKLG